MKKNIVIYLFISNALMFFFQGISKGIYTPMVSPFRETFFNHNTLINSYVLKMTPRKYRGTGFGLFSTLYTIIYSMGPVVTGFFNDQFNMVIGMRITLIAIVIAFLLIVKFDYFIDTESRKKLELNGNSGLT